MDEWMRLDRSYGTWCLSIINLCLFLRYACIDMSKTGHSARCFMIEGDRFDAAGLVLVC